MTGNGKHSTEKKMVLTRGWCICIIVLPTLPFNAVFFITLDMYMNSRHTFKNICLTQISAALLCTLVLWSFLRLGVLPKHWFSHGI